MEVKFTHKEMLAAATVRWLYGRTVKTHYTPQQIIAAIKNRSKTKKSPTDFSYSGLVNTERGP